MYVNGTMVEDRTGTILQCVQNLILVQWEGEDQEDAEWVDTQDHTVHYLPNQKTEVKETPWRCLSCTRPVGLSQWGCVGCGRRLCGGCKVDFCDKCLRGFDTMVSEIQVDRMLPHTVVFFWDGSARGDHSAAGTAVCAVDPENRLLGTFWIDVTLDQSHHWFVGADALDNVTAEFSGAIYTLKIILAMIKQNYRFNKIILAPDLDLVKDFLTYKGRIKAPVMRRVATTLMYLWNEVKEVVSISWRVVKGHTGVYGNELVNLLAQFAMTHHAVAYTQFFPPWVPSIAKTFPETDIRGAHRNLYLQELTPRFLQTAPAGSFGVGELTADPLWLARAKEGVSGMIRFGAEGGRWETEVSVGEPASSVLLATLQELGRAMSRPSCRYPKLIIVRLEGGAGGRPGLAAPSLLYRERFQIMKEVYDIRRRAPILFA